MDFLKEIKPYRQYIDLYLDGRQASPYEVSLKISEVYDRLRKHESVKIYGFQNNEIATTDLGCSACVSDMMSNLRNWIKAKEKEVPTVSFNALALKWPELKKYCASIGIDVINKKKEDLLEELKKRENANT